MKRLGRWWGCGALLSVAAGAWLAGETAQAQTITPTTPTLRPAAQQKGSTSSSTGNNSTSGSSTKTTKQPTYQIYAGTTTGPYSTGAVRPRNPGSVTSNTVGGNEGKVTQISPLGIYQPGVTPYQSNFPYNNNSFYPGPGPYPSPYATPYANPYNTMYPSPFTPWQPTPYSPYVNPYANNPYVNNPYVNNPYVNNPYVNNPYLNNLNPYANPYLNPNVNPYANPYSNPYTNPYNPYANPYNPYVNPYTSPMANPYIFPNLSYPGYRPPAVQLDNAFGGWGSLGGVGVRSY
jgi:hypothetical protein